MRRAPRRAPPLIGCMLALLVVLPVHALPAGSEPVRHDLRVRLDPQARELVGEDTLWLAGSGRVELWLDPGFTVEAVTLDGAAREIARDGRGRWRLDLGPGPRSATVGIRYRGRLQPLVRADHREVLGSLPPMADQRGSYLPAGSGWYPQVPGRLLTYRLALDLPRGQRGLVPGRLLDERHDAERTVATFASEQPVEDLALMAGPYGVQEREARLPSGAGVRLRTYLHPEVADLAEGYLASAEEYLALYSRWIGDYPFGEFSIVSSPLPTGFGMPTLTYLGTDVLRLPFIRRTSLGHEVLHNWWGNGAYVDWANGNWSEGLTTFMADYTYAEREGPEAARQARLAWLRDFAAVPPGADLPLARFTARRHGTSQVVGYGKAAFLFLMLRDWIGPAAFDDGVRRFWREQRGRAAGWGDLQRAFQDASGQDLGGFFHQWLGQAGAPTVRIERARLEASGGGYRLHVSLAQGEPPYLLHVPLRVTTERGEEERRLPLASSRQEFLIPVPARPISLALDPEFRLFRRLAPGEAPAILRQAMLDPTTVTISVSADPSVEALARQIAGRLLDHGVRLAPAGDPAPEAPLLVIGLAADVDRFLERHGFRRPAEVDGQGTAQAWAASTPSGKALVVVSAETAEALRSILAPLPHYGRQSYVVFDGPRLRARGTWPGQSPAWRFDEDHRGFAPQAPRKK